MDRHPFMSLFHPASVVRTPSIIHPHLTQQQQPGMIQVRMSVRVVVIVMRMSMGGMSIHIIDEVDTRDETVKDEDC